MIKISVLSKIVWRSCIALGVVGSFVMLVIIAYLNAHLPSVDSLKDIQLQVPLKIFTQDGKLIAEYGEKRRNPVVLEEVPKNLIHAILATEDHRFYQHPGVDLRGLLRAFVALVATGNKEQGGSTITMQVARNFFFTRKKTYIRKINEILLSLKIEKELTKNEILELYLNKIYFGKRAYGIQAAAEVYYGTTIDKLTLAQMAMIAGIPQAPSTINPLNSPNGAFKRRTHVLDRMRRYGYISNEEYQEALEEPITAVYHARPIEVNAPYIAELARQEMIERYGDDAYVKGYEVYTTIDSRLQQAANLSLKKALHEYDERHGYRGPVTTLAFDSNKTAEQELEAWQTALQSFANVGDLIPVVVAAVDNQTFWAISKDGQSIEVHWDQMKWAKPHISYQRTGPEPAAATDIVKVGNVVYLQSTSKGHWRLSQIPEVEGALVSMHPYTGAILSMVGGYNFNKSPFNRAVQADRQPGSNFKPFIYSAALENGFTAASIINDAPIVQEDPSGEHDWRPQNHTLKFYGPTRLRVGITQSRNLVSIRLLQALGIPKTIKFLSNFGFSKEALPEGLSLALGAGTITPLALATAYCTFPNGGYKISPYFLNKISDYQDHAIDQAEPNILCDTCNIPNKAIRVISPQTAYIMTSMLQDAIQSGTGRRLKQLGRRDIGGKTGSTNDHSDAWYTGYNNDIVTTTWVGFDEPKSLHEYAVKAALPMWMYYMQEALKGKPENSPIQPEGLTTVKIDPISGLLARSGQPDAIYEIFTHATLPKQIAPPPVAILKGKSGENNEPIYNSTLETLF